MSANPNPPDDLSPAGRTIWELLANSTPAPVTRPESIGLQFTAHEARALRNAAAMMSEVWDGVLAEDPDLLAVVEREGVPPLHVAVMKLELALVAGGHES